MDCLNGVDNDVNLSSIADLGYSFVMRYLGGPCYNARIPLTNSERQALLNAGLMVGTLLCSGSNNVVEYNCGIQMMAQEIPDGESTVEQAEAASQPLGSATYLDLRSDQVSSQSIWLSYVEGWTTAVAAGGYRPGVYSSRTQLDIIQGQPFGETSL